MGVASNSSARTDGARSLELKSLGGRGDQLAGLRSALEPAFAPGFEPAEICTRELERGAALSQRGKGIVVKAREWFAAEPLQVASEALGVATERVGDGSAFEVCAKKRK